MPNSVKCEEWRHRSKSKYAWQPLIHLWQFLDFPRWHLVMASLLLPTLEVGDESSLPQSLSWRKGGHGPIEWCHQPAPPGSFMKCSARSHERPVTHLRPAPSAKACLRRRLGTTRKTESEGCSISPHVRPGVQGVTTTDSSASEATPRSRAISSQASAHSVRATEQVLWHIWTSSKNT